MDAKKCDRCGKYYTVDFDFLQLFKEEPDEDDYPFGTKEVKKDLCNECAMDLLLWFERPEIKKGG